MSDAMHWPPKLQQSNPPPPPPSVQLELRVLSDVEKAFPARVSPPWEESPLEYWKNSERNYCEYKRNHPWVELASALFDGAVDSMKLRMFPREGVDASAAFDWASACLGSYELKHEYKLVVTAWVLESFFCAYWFEGSSEPDWAPKSIEYLDLKISKMLDLVDDWDQQGSVAPNGAVIELAQEFALVAQGKLWIHSVVADAEGGVSFRLGFPPDDYCDVLLHNDGEYTCLLVSEEKGPLVLHLKPGLSAEDLVTEITEKMEEYGREST